MKKTGYMESPLGKIKITEKDGAIIGLSFAADQPGSAAEDISEEFFEDSPLIREAARQLTEYFSGNLEQFSVPVSLDTGTDFQKKVWAALLEIPFGETKSYKEVAVMVANPKGARAIGMANNRNPIAIIVPCHRVIGSDGSMVGYGSGLPIKEHLLALEKKKK